MIREIKKPSEQGIIYKLMRLFDKRWLLKNLKNDWNHSHLGVNITLEQIIAGQSDAWGIQKSAYLQTLSNLPEIKSLNDGDKTRKMDYLESIIKECYLEGLIDINKGSVNGGTPESCLKVSSKGDKYLSEFWYNHTLGNEWVKIIGTGLVVSLTTAVVVWLLSKPTNQDISSPIINNITTPDVNVYPNIYLNATTTPQK